MFIGIISWKNIWRNKLRSLVVISAVALGVFAGVFSIALINSSVEQRIDAAVNDELSHIQINTRDFRKSRDILSTLPDYDSLLSIISQEPELTGITPRIIINGIASTSAKSIGVEISGIDVGREQSMFGLSSKLVQGTGSYFGRESSYNSVFVGEKLAKELRIIRFLLDDDAIRKLTERKLPDRVIKALLSLKDLRFTTQKKFTGELEKLLSASDLKHYGHVIAEEAWSYREGSRIILTFLDVRGIQTSAAFRVTGIFRTNNDMFEAGSVFVPHEELRSLTGLKKDEWHRLLCRLSDDRLTIRAADSLRSTLANLEVLAWKEIQPDLAMLADMMYQIYGLFMAIILAALAFGLVNTMLMSVLERTRELGMLTAIGMNRRRVFIMILTESVLLSLVGGLGGMALSAVVTALTARNGINLVKYSEGMEAFGFSAYLKPEIDLPFFLLTTALIIATGILSSLYPARKALKLNPVEALRKE